MCNIIQFLIFLLYDKGLSVIQQRYDPKTKYTLRTDIDKVYVDDIYLNKNFFDLYSDKSNEKKEYTQQLY